MPPKSADRARKLQGATLTHRCYGADEARGIHRRLLCKRFDGRSSKDAMFTGTVYIYCEGDLREDERAKVRSAFKDRGATVYFRNHASL